MPEKKVEFVIENILDMRLVRGKVEYFIKWEGYGEADNSWEPEATLKRSASETVAEYRNSEEGKAKAAELNLRTPKAKTPVQGGIRRSARLSAAHSETSASETPAASEDNKGSGKRRGRSSVVEAPGPKRVKIVETETPKRKKAVEGEKKDGAKTPKGRLAGILTEEDGSKKVVIVGANNQFKVVTAPEAYEEFGNALLDFLMGCTAPATV